MSRFTHHRPSLLRRVGVACVLATALLLLPLPASGGIAWDAGIALGYAALVVAATLYLYPLRGEGLPHKRLFTLSQHRRLGWIALTLGLLHTAILLITQPLVGHYLLPSAPIYMLLGLAALIALAILVATGLAARSALRNTSTRSTTSSSPTLPTSVTTHAILAALLLALTAAHILGSHQLTDNPVKAITVCLLLALPLLWAALRAATRSHRSSRTGNSQPPPTRTALKLLPTLLPSSAAAALLFLLPIPTATPHLLQQAVTPSVLPVAFPHEKHTTVSCVTCHHNFIDKTGVGSCLECHRTPSPALTQSAEATFHTFCRSCHTALAETTGKHGPTRACSACHVNSSTTH